MDHDTITTMQELRDLVDSNDGVVTTTMKTLRVANGNDRLGVHVLDGIRKALDGMGLGHHPSELPNSQLEFVRLYRKGSPAGILIEAALKPDENTDGLLRRAAGGEDAVTLQRVRELVCS